MLVYCLVVRILIEVGNFGWFYFKFYNLFEWLKEIFESKL